MVETLPNKSKLLVSNIYRHPNSPISWFDNMNLLVDNFNATKLDFITTCDMNCDLLKQPIGKSHKAFCICM